MDNLPALLPHATPLVSRFCAEISKNGVVVKLEKKFSILVKFAEVSCNYKQQLSQNNYSVIKTD
jgi:hypothetical protein